jgi:hypothetical protein
MSCIDLCRHVGCDILQLDGWGTAHPFRSPELRWPDGVTATTRQREDMVVRELRCGSRVLTGAEKRGHPIEYIVKTSDDLGLYREIWEGVGFVGRDDGAAYELTDALVGEDGVVVRFWGPSAIPRLLEKDIGIQNFYYLLQDCPREMDDLIQTMHQRELAAFEILACGPCEVVILVENTSTYYISRDAYRRYNGPHVRDFVDIMHSCGKIALVHMCGHVLDILPDIRQTGLDGIHALTPPPTGNTPWEVALDVLGEDVVIVGALDPSIFILGPVEGIGAALDCLYTDRLRRAHFVLCPFADGVPVALERFKAVALWMQEKGRAG